MKRGPFAPSGLCCPAAHHYYGPLRPPLGRPTTSRGSPVIGGHRFPSLPATGPRRLSPVPRTTVRTFSAHYAGGFIGARSRNWGAFHGLRRGRSGSAPSHRPKAARLTTLARGFTHVADRAVASAPLRTRPLGHARGHRYRGSGHLPGPDSHRRAALSLSLGYVMSDSFLSWRPSFWAHRAEGEADLMSEYHVSCELGGS